MVFGEKILPVHAYQILHVYCFWKKIHLVIFGHCVSQNCLPKITKRKLRGYCYLEIGQNFTKTIYLKGDTENYENENFEGENYEVAVYVKITNNHFLTI